MRDMCHRYYPDVPTVIVQPGVKTGVPIRMDNPKEVGSDRIMNSLAAVHLYGGPAIVVDFGTSTNFDAVSAKGEFVGGALAPGIEISVDALSRRAAQLLKVELTRPPRVVGKNTVEALQSGIVYGFAGQVEGIARRMAAELSPEDPGAVTVIATGGLASLVIDEVPIIDAHEPWLTLIGLRLVWERNTVVSRGDDPPYPPVSVRADLIAKTAIVSGSPARTIAPRGDDPDRKNRDRTGPGDAQADSDAVPEGDPR
jgi:type III pantothenate kinase